MICIVANDAGGAEILSSYVKQKNLDCIFTLTGPALTIFQRKLGNITNTPLEQSILNSDLVLTGTGWQGNLEWNAIKIAKHHNKKSIAYLDHWINYQERFTRNNTLLLPDEIWVGDSYAKELAKKNFPSILINLVPNPYFITLKDDLEKLSEKNTLSDSKKNLNILYICEPVKEHALLHYGNERHWGYTEEEALRYFLSKIQYSSQSINILIRPHPAEVKNKYEWVLNEYNHSICFSSGKTLLEEIAESHIVVGCESMAMVVGLIAKKRVISCIPPSMRQCSLPHSEIKHLRQLTDFDVHKLFQMH